MNPWAERGEQSAEGTTLLPSALRARPVPLTRAQRILFAVFAISIALTRIPALSLTLHDWDETLFSAGVSEYDVKHHHPHPPGYPLFVALAKLARLFTGSDFHAARAIAMLASMLVFPAAFRLARELRFRTSFAFAAAALTAFLPPVWYYGGTALSDVPALTLILFACALLLRGGTSARAYAAGALVTALACAIRPHLLVVAAPCALLGALALRRVRAIAGAWAAAAAVVFVAYFAAAYFSSDFPNGYLSELEKIQKHLRETDSFRNPYRTPLRELAPRVFLYPMGGGRMKYAIVALAAIALLDALVRRRANVALVVAMFLPMAVLTWLMLDMSALARYAVAYLPLHAFLAVAGVEALARLAPPRAKLPLFVVLAGFVTWSLVKWTWPALRFARTEPSPAVAAFQWIRSHVPHPGPRVYVQNTLLYHAYYLIPDYDFRLVFNETPLTDDDYSYGNVFVFEGESDLPGTIQFRRKRLQLWELARPRYFEVGITPMHRVVRYGEGWHLEETDGHNRWRWMQREARVTLSPLVQGDGELRLRLHAPVDALPRPPVVTLTWNGALLDRRTAPADGNLELVYTLSSRRGGTNELRIATDEVITPPGDGRELGLSLEKISWGEAAGRRAGPLQ